MPIENSSSSLPIEERLVSIPLSRLHPHPKNPNLMSEEHRQTLRRNIERTGEYPPLVVRPHPECKGEFQMLDGEQRMTVLAELDHEQALCYLWPCDDATALTLLATVNQLRGEDVPIRRAELLSELAELMPVAELALLLPEDAGTITDLLDLLDLDAEQLLADLVEASDRAGDALRSITFAVSAEDEGVIEAAVATAAERLEGKNRRGRALAAIAHFYLEDAGHD